MTRAERRNTARAESKARKISFRQALSVVNTTARMKRPRPAKVGIKVKPRRGRVLGLASVGAGSTGTLRSTLRELRIMAGLRPKLMPRRKVIRRFLGSQWDWKTRRSIDFYGITDGTLNPTKGFTGLSVRIEQIERPRQGRQAAA